MIDSQVFSLQAIGSGTLTMDSVNALGYPAHRQIQSGCFTELSLEPS